LTYSKEKQQIRWHLCDSVLMRSQLSVIHKKRKKQEQRKT